MGKLITKMDIRTNISDNKSKILHGDCKEILELLEPNHFQAIIADPPYFQVLLEENWDNQWHDEQDYLTWTEDWVTKALQFVLYNQTQSLPFHK